MCIFAPASALSIWERGRRENPTFNDEGFHSNPSYDSFRCRSPIHAKAHCNMSGGILLEIARAARQFRP